jgi:site-specific DNA-methyltransferase (adenine-specific)
MIFSKGEPRALRIDAKKDKAEPGIKHFMKGTSGMLPTSFDYAKPSKKDMIHQAEKPVELLEAILEYTTKENELILDQFAGSGALGEAAQNKKRKCILIELSDEFVDRIRTRLDLKKGVGA